MAGLVVDASVAAAWFLDAALLLAMPVAGVAAFALEP